MLVKLLRCCCSQKLTQCQVTAVYLLPSKAAAAAISTWAVRGLLLCGISLGHLCSMREPHNLTVDNLSPL